jgi:hypothetical protein
MPPKSPRNWPMKGGLPRVYRNHHSRAGVAYRRAYEALAARFPGAPPLWLREGALAVLELERLATEAALARERGLRRKPATLDRQAARVRDQLLAIEARLAEQTKPAEPTVEERLAAARALSQPKESRS